jgi:hypothetical protein
MTERSFNFLDTPPLRGEAPEGRFGLRTGTGVQVEPYFSIFPIIRVDADGRIDLLGTGFFISKYGLFLTARHVLEAPFDRKSGRQLFAIGILQSLEENEYIYRPILRCALHPSADVAVGVAAPMKKNQDGTDLVNPVLRLSIVPVELNAHVVTFAYPRYTNFIGDNNEQIFKLMPAYYDGHILEYLPYGRDRILLPGCCYRTNMAIHHGASGGPVFSREGTAFAVNSTGFDGTDDSYVSGLEPILDLRIDDVVMDNQPARSVRIRDMVHAGHILVHPPL